MTRAILATCFFRTNGYLVLDSWRWDTLGVSAVAGRTTIVPPDGTNSGLVGHKACRSIRYSQTFCKLEQDTTPCVIVTTCFCLDCHKPVAYESLKVTNLSYSVQLAGLRSSSNSPKIEKTAVLCTHIQYNNGDKGWISVMQLEFQSKYDSSAGTGNFLSNDLQFVKLKPLAK